MAQTNRPHCLTFGKHEVSGQVPHLRYTLFSRIYPDTVYAPSITVGDISMDISQVGRGINQLTYHEPENLGGKPLCNFAVQSMEVYRRFWKILNGTPRVNVRFG